MANLAAKYRPKTLEDVTEQSIVVDMVRNLCSKPNLEARNFLFTGPAGCGKTTLCRIIANILNKGQGSPIEIDAASHSGVDSVREIVSQAQSYPVGCEWKCFIIDEVHAISNQGWQAFLKTLEESPAKSIFLMATTNPEKIPATIISRVQTFQLSKISLQGIESRLKYIVSKENEEGQDITYEDSAISFIAKMANGGMRDSITLLEKAIAYDKHITSKGLVQALGLPNYDDFFSLLQAYAKKDNGQIAQIVDQVYNSGINFVKWMSDFHSFVVNVMRSAGIPARPVYVPRWSHCDDNHAWVELWCDGKWYFTGACEPLMILNKGVVYQCFFQSNDDPFTCV